MFGLPGIGGFGGGGLPGVGGFGGFGTFGGGMGGVDHGQRAPMQEGGTSLAGVPEEVRQGFVVKVYGILSTQLTLTLVVAGLVVHQGSAMQQQHPTLAMGMLFCSVFTSMLMMFIFSCCPDTMRRSPLNYGLLFLFTFGKGAFVGFISLQFTKASVMVAVAITLLAVVALTIIACCTSIDFTGYAPYMGCAIMILCGFGFFMMLAGMFGLGNSPAFQFLPMIFAAMGAMIFSAYIVFDTQLIIGGRHHKFEFGIDDYAMAAISIYTDIIQLFVFMLQIVGKREERH